MADGRHLAKSKMRHILATDWPILMKFGRLTQIENIQNCNFNKSNMADGRHLEKSKMRHISATDRPILMKLSTVMQILCLKRSSR